jgi:tRNA-guanine family transglycosylase
VKEENAKMLLTVHNICFVTQLMEKARTAIKEGSFERLRKKYAKAD